jgi:hypothetical protein
MIYKEKGKEKHTLISLLPQEELDWPHERPHVRPQDGSPRRIPMNAVAGWRRLASPDTLDAAAAEHHHLHLLYSNFAAFRRGTGLVL